MSIAVRPIPLEKLNGAAFGPTPDVVTSAIGRGVMLPISSLYCVCQSSGGVNSDMIILKL